jgi:GPI mannosyltransferase 3
MVSRARRFLLGATHVPGDTASRATTHLGLIFWALLTIAFVLRLAAAILFPSVHHPDETFQYWEQGYRLAFGYGVVPWEYRTGIRSYLIPGLIAGVMRLTSILGGGAGAWQIAVQSLLSLLSLTIVVTAFAWGRRVGGTRAAVFCGLIACVWFEAIYFAGKPLTESISASLIFPAAYLLCVPRLGRKWLVAGGALLGLAFIVRFQLAPAVLAIGLICLLVNGWRGSLLAALSALGIIVASGLLDWATLGLPFQSIWLNFVVNAIEDKASTYGVEPFYWFGLSYVTVWWVFVGVLAALALFGGRRAPTLLIIALIIVLAHSAIGHKEYRFIYPALPFLLTAIGLGLAALYDRYSPSLRPNLRWAFAATVGVAICGTSLFLAQRDIYRAQFTRGADVIAAFQSAAEAPGLCGVGFAGIGWFDTPGYRGLGRNVPLYPLLSQADATTLAPAYNVLVSWGPGWESLRGQYSEVECHGDVCVAIRPGTCSAQSDRTINPYLVETGQ